LRRDSLKAGKFDTAKGSAHNIVGDLKEAVKESNK